MFLFCFFNNLLFKLDYDYDGRYKYTDDINIGKEIIRLDKEIDSYDVTNDKDKNIYLDTEKNWDNELSKKYLLQSPEDLIVSKCGVCWDQVELERGYLDIDNIDFDSYFIVNYDGNIYPTHTFIIVRNNGEYIWIENSWKRYRGLHKYNSLEDALLDIKEKFNNMIKKDYSIKNNDTIIYKYNKPKYDINGSDFFNHCENGEKVNI